MTGEAGAPAAVRLVRDFINTYEPQEDDESLTSPEQLRDWLTGRALLPPGTRVTGAQRTAALRLREGLRTALSDGDPGSLNDALAEVPVRLVLTGSGPALAPVRAAAFDRAMAALVDAIRACGQDSTWSRLKVCARDSCRWAFYDESRNQARRWCSMAGCGNHIKMRRAYAARKALRG
jgi:predicted RNA-binding Zn ribbon-like protein